MLGIFLHESSNNGRSLSPASQLIERINAAGTGTTAGKTRAVPMNEAIDGVNGLVVSSVKSRVYSKYQCLHCYPILMLSRIS